MTKPTVLPIWLLLFLLLTGCGTTSYQFATAEQVRLENTTNKTDINNLRRCRNSAHYIPDTSQLYLYPERTVKINIHFVNNTDRTANFPDEEQARQFALQMVADANRYLRDNQPMHLPVGNTTPVLPIRLQYQITRDFEKPGDDGIYFHYTDKYFFNDHKNQRTLFNRWQYDNYGIQKQEVINVFIMPHHPDSVRSASYPKSTGGVGTPHWVKLTGVYYQSQQKAGEIDGNPYYFGPWFAARLLNHEIGHTLGLAHTWNTNDGCDDTPRHANCWNYSDRPPCNEEVSNNVMDYNTYKNAYTPCQIGQIHYRLSADGTTQREKLVEDWCYRQPGMDVEIGRNDSVNWECFRELRGNLRLKKGSHLNVYCRLSMPKNAKIIIEPGATLVVEDATITNTCGDTWSGIEIGTNRKAEGQLVLRGNAQLQQLDHPIPQKVISE